ncbi:hypothetical protein KM043_015082 [Ampulex compressa]|nr:hypothetical protein KM043_015082 [Ampulex compressa]
MEVERFAMFAGVGLFIAVAAFVIWGPSPRPRRKGKVVGINNLGYTCYLNSLLQAMAACPTFTIWLQRQREKSEKGPFVAALISVFEKINGYSDDLYGDVTPFEIISSLGPLWNFGPGHQDAHELLHVVLSALQAEIQPVNRTGSLSDALPPSPTIVPDAKGAGDAISLRSVSCNDIVSVEKDINTPNGFDKNCNSHLITSTSSVLSMSITCNKPGMILARSSELLSRNHEGSSKNEGSFRPWSSLCTMPFSSLPSKSVEVHPFSGLLTSQLQCSNCKWKSAVRYDKLETISLPLPPAGLHIGLQHTLEDLLLRFVSSEIVHDVLCDGCTTRCIATKTLTLGKLPKCLCLHISRTELSTSGKRKNERRKVTWRQPCLLLIRQYYMVETSISLEQLLNIVELSILGILYATDVETVQINGCLPPTL